MKLMRCPTSPSYSIRSFFITSLSSFVIAIDSKSRISIILFQFPILREAVVDVQTELAKEGCSIK